MKTVDSYRCRKCNETKPTSKFTPDKSRKNKVYPYCHDCKRTWAREYRKRPKTKLLLQQQTARRYKNNRESCKKRTRRCYLKRMFDTTPERVEILRRQQGNRCAICKCEQRPNKDFAIDHDHATGRIRGLLCSRCNMTMGALNDDAALLEKMVTYLKTTPHPRPLVIVEAPYQSDRKKFAAYLGRCVQDTVRRGESAISSVATFALTGALDDKEADERAAGIRAGLVWYEVADACVVYMDFGVSEGMQRGIDEARYWDVPIDYRKI